MKQTMKILIFLVLLSPNLWGQIIPQVNPTAKIFYGGGAEQINDSTASLFNAGIEVGVNIKYKKFIFDFLNRTSMLSIAGNSIHKLGYYGKLNFEFSYSFSEAIRPFIGSFNEFDTVFNANIIGYTGGGVHFGVYRDKNFVFLTDIGMMFQYEDYEKEFENREKKNYTFSYYLGAGISYSFLEILTVGSGIKLIPVFDFSEVRFITNIWLKTELFREKDKLFFGREIIAEHELRLEIDAISIHEHNFKRTRYTCISAFRIYF